MLCLFDSITIYTIYIMTNHNLITGDVYQGRNQRELEITRVKNKWISDEWLTFLQARDQGLKIIKGSTGVSVFKGFLRFEDENEKGETIRTSASLGFARVFNMEQTEKLLVNKNPKQ